jgi:hypothetical protein
LDLLNITTFHLTLLDWSAHLKDASEVEPRLVDTDEEDVEE